MTERKSVTEEEKEREGKEKYLNVKKKKMLILLHLRSVSPSSIEMI